MVLVGNRPDDAVLVKLFPTTIGSVEYIDGQFVPADYIRTEKICVSNSPLVMTSDDTQILSKSYMTIM